MRLSPSKVVLTLAAALLFTFAACAQTTATLTGDPAHPAITSGWLDTTLYFGLGLANASHQGVSEARWRRFLDKEVTPRFPSGLSVLDVYGQWLSKRGQMTPGSQPERIRSKMLILLYPASPEADASIEAIRIAWKKLTGDQSVLKVTTPAEVSF